MEYNKKYRKQFHGFDFFDKKINPDFLIPDKEEIVTDDAYIQTDEFNKKNTF